MGYIQAVLNQDLANEQITKVKRAGMAPAKVERTSTRNTYHGLRSRFHPAYLDGGNPVKEE
jgi:hypothetical protein